MAKSVAVWFIIQSRVAEQHNRGCTLAGCGSLWVGVEHWAAAGQEAAEGTLAGRG